MFWTTVKGLRRIERSTLSGKNRKKLITNGLRFPSGLTIDYVTRRIYWVDGSFGRIEVTNYEGNNRKNLREQYISIPTYLTVSGSFIYSTDRGLMNGILKFSKEPGRNSDQEFLHISEKPLGIAEFNTSRQIRGG